MYLTHSSRANIHTFWGSTRQALPQLQATISVWQLTYSWWLKYAPFFLQMWQLTAQSFSRWLQKYCLYRQPSKLCEISRLQLLVMQGISNISIANYEWPRHHWVMSTVQFQPMHHLLLFLLLQPLFVLFTLNLFLHFILSSFPCISDISHWICMKMVDKNPLIL